MSRFRKRKYELIFPGKEAREGVMVYGDDEGPDVMPARKLYGMHLKMARRIANRLETCQTKPCAIEVDTEWVAVTTRNLIHDWSIEAITECFDSKYWRWCITDDIKRRGVQFLITYDWEEEFEEENMGRI